MLKKKLLKDVNWNSIVSNMPQASATQMGVLDAITYKNKLQSQRMSQDFIYRIGQFVTNWTSVHIVGVNGTPARDIVDLYILYDGLDVYIKEVTPLTSKLVIKITKDFQIYMQAALGNDFGLFFQGTAGGPLEEIVRVSAFPDDAIDITAQNEYK